MKHVKRKTAALLFFALITACKRDELSYKYIVSTYKSHKDSLTGDSFNNFNHLTFQERRYFDASLVTLFRYSKIDEEIPVSIMTFFLKKRYGHSFLFDSKGAVNQYAYFLAKDLNVSYEVDVKNGALSNEKGSVFVDYIKHEKFTNVFSLP